MPKKKEPGTCAYEGCRCSVWKKGGQEEKFCLFHSDQFDAKEEEFRREIEAVKQGEPTKLFRVTSILNSFIGTGYYFSGFKFPKSCKSIFSKHTFEENVSFNNSVWEESAVFTEMVFQGEADFEGVRAARSISFWSVEAAKGLNLKKCEAPLVSLRSLRSKYNVNLEEAIVKHKVEILGGKIEYNLILSNADISRYVDIFSLHIEGSVFCENARVGRLIDFHMVSIDGDGDYTNISTKILNIGSSNFGGNLTLTGARLGQLIADNCSYEGFFSFIDVVFGEKRSPASSFKNVMLERANFVNVDLSNVSFKNAFFREVNLDRIQFNRAQDNERWKWNSFFCGRPTEALYEEMTARKYRTQTLHRLKHWGLLNVFRFRVPLWIKLRKRWKRLQSIHKRMSLPFASAETSYRSLKHVMEQQHAHGMARKMRAGELECKFQQLHNWRPEKWIRSIYRFLNGFGLKWARALLFYVLTLGLFTWGYCDRSATFNQYSYREEKFVQIETRSDFWDAIRHSLEVNAVIKQSTLTFYDQNIHWLEGLQRIVSPVLLLLLGQAVRNVTRD